MGAIARFIRRRRAAIPDGIYLRRLPAMPARLSKVKWKRNGKAALAVFAFLFLAPIPVAEFMYLSFLLGRYGKGRRIVGRIVRRIRK